jgi:hypothetical protein
MEFLLIVSVGAAIAFLWCCRWRTFTEDSNCPAVFEIVTVRTDDGIFCEAKYLDDGLWMPVVNVTHWRRGVVPVVAR